MPSSPNYKRNYKQEAAAESSTRKEQRRERNQGRREYIKVHGESSVKGKDVDHKQPLSEGGSDSIWNLRTLAPHDNRSYPRNPDGSIKD